MYYEENVNEVIKSLDHLRESGVYDVEKLTYSLVHLTSQLEFFYCNLVKDDDLDHTYYHLHHRPKEGQIAYFNIGRGFPKELMDGHWCYILKDLGYKAIVIPTTSIKEDSDECDDDYQMDITIRIGRQLARSRIQLSDIRAIDLQRMDTRKKFRTVVTDQDEIKQFVKERLF